MHLPAKLLAPLAALACTAVLATPTAAEPTEQLPNSRPCKDMKWAYVNGIRVRGVGCPQAKRVIVRYTRLMNERLQHDWEITVLGFTCDLTGKDYYGDSHRCTAGGGRGIVFRRGTHA
ncbi:MAG TPA: hypothetical protein VFR75_02270 [Solirubrobacterales bacterium]|nr:hypothetical protein [Solirubrobacterales bacterium]